MSSKYNVSIDFNACKECGYCKLVCKKDVFEKGSDFNEKGYRSYKVVNADKCVGCNKCFFACPDFALNVEKVED